MKKLYEWKKTKTRQALMITGARQVGKTTLVREFAFQEYRRLAEVNFFETPLAVETLAAAKNVDDLLLRLSALTGVSLVPGETLLFLDEVQECKDMLTWMKFLTERANLDVILSGSLLGLDAYVQVRSLPVGFLRTIDMYPLTFEEFALSTGVASEVWEVMERSVLECREVPDYIHDLLIRKFREYLLVGGMPDAVQAYVNTSQIVPTREIQRDIFALYESDIVKYVEDATESRQIKMVYESIPAQLNTPTKRFKYARIQKNLRFANLETAFDWLTSAGIALEATRVGELDYPLGMHEDRTAFKFFLNDIGMLTSRLMGTVDIDVINGKTDINYGSLYEAVVAQELIAHGMVPHYYASKKRGEIDFVVENQSTGAVTVIEVKSGKDYRRHSALTSLLESGEVERAIVLCNGNVQQADGRLYIPVYASHLVRQV
ncbi:ATP-binding protein [Collinsella intestinalis]|uniref:ATP-binding protein n=1 Tax=Collinsella intestinalis TaxID=147207 RepID=UPI0022E76F8B|nr:AAA family ATPase [Collinsella intestinalis]